MERPSEPTFPALPATAGATVAWAGLGFAVVLALTAHALVSPLGFSPTDEGFILAQSRRVLAGEVPHRDFVTIRPALSAFLHAPELLLGGRHAFLLSRFVFWLESALICWAWVEIARARIAPAARAVVVLPLLALAFLLTTHVFPPMAWHTVDGLLLASLGLLVSWRAPGRWGLVGCALVGASVLCKQSFAPLLPALVVLDRRWRRPSAWIAAGLPIALYAGLVAAAGGFGDMRAQLLAATDLRKSGIRPFVKHPWAPLGVALGIVAATLPRARFARGVPRRVARLAPWAGALLVWLAFVLAARDMDGHFQLFLERGAFLQFGVVAGMVVAAAAYREAAAATVMVALVLAWCVSLSLGYLSPALATGPLAIVAALAWPQLAGRPGRVPAWAAGVLVGAALCVVAPGWWTARHAHIYHEMSAPALEYRLDGVLPGGGGIRTDRNTWEVLADLRDAVRRVRGRPYAILVDAACWWVGAEEANPLPCDWPQGIELCTPALEARFQRTMLSQRGRVALLVQKVQLGRLKNGFLPVVPGSYYRNAVLAGAAYRKRAETRFWTIYE